MLVAIAVLALMLVAVSAAVVWAAMEIVALKADAARSTDVDQVAEELEALTNVVQRQSGKVSVGLQKATSDVRSISETEVRIQAQVTALSAELNRLRDEVKRATTDGTILASKVDGGIAQITQLSKTITDSIASVTPVPRALTMEGFLAVDEEQLSGAGAVPGATKLRRQ